MRLIIIIISSAVFIGKIQIWGKNRRNNKKLIHFILFQFAFISIGPNLETTEHTTNKLKIHSKTNKCTNEWDTWPGQTGHWALDTYIYGFAVDCFFSVSDYRYLGLLAV